MATLKELSKNVARHMTIFPYKEAKKMPVYRDASGNTVELSEKWREIGFKVKWPTVGNIEKLDASKTSYTDKDKQIVFSASHQQSANAIVYELIEDIEGLDEPWDMDSKKWLLSQFLLSSFLMTEFKRVYKEAGEKWAEEEEQKQADFFPESDETSPSSSKDITEHPISESAKS